MRSQVRSVARLTAIARCAVRRMARLFVVVQASKQVTFAGRKDQNSSRFMSLRPVRIAGFAVSVGRLCLVASISSRPSTACRSAHWTTTRELSQRGTCSLRTRPRGMTLPMTYRSSRSYQQRLPNPAAQSDAFRPALNAPTHSAPGRER